MATKKKRLVSALSKVRRMEREYEEPEYDFDPEDQPEPEARPHHFAVNGRFNEQSIEELYDDVISCVYDPQENEDIIPFTRQQVGFKMLNWHGGQGDPVYAVGSTYFDERGAFSIYPDVDILKTARSHLKSDLRKTRKKADRAELATIIMWLDWEIQNS